MSGRKKFPVWIHFDQIKQFDKKGHKAKCKHCNLEIQGQVTRLQKHIDEKCSAYNQREVTALDVCSAPSSSKSKEQNITKLGNVSGLQKRQSELRTRSDGEFVRTSDSHKNVIDAQLAKFFYSTNTPFRHVEHPEFKKLCDILRPGYCPPNRDTLGNQLLDKVYDSVLEDCTRKFENQTVTMALDGWSNVKNEPIVACSIVNQNGQYALVESVDTSGNSHDAEYLKSLALAAISNCEEKFKVRIASFVTDNTGNVTKMRRELEKEDDMDIIQYGCSAHILELLSKDLKIQSVEGPVLKIIKYFRNTHLAAAWYRRAKGKKLPLPHAVRWNSVTDSIRAFLKNRGILVQICHDHRAEVDPDIYKLVNDVNLLNNADDYCRRLKPIAIALDRMQRDNTTIAVAVEIWLKLRKALEREPAIVKAKLNSRQNMALGPAHYLANMMDHRFRGDRLTELQKSKAYEYLNEVNESLLPILMSHCSENSIFSGTLYGPSFRTFNPVVWWKSVLIDEDQTICDWSDLKSKWIPLCEQLLTATASTAGLERIFSTFGLVQSKLRNRLGNAKAAKLTFIFKWVNQKGSSKKKTGLTWIWNDEQEIVHDSESEDARQQSAASNESESEPDIMEIQSDEDEDEPPPPKRRSLVLPATGDSESEVETD